MKQKNSYKMLSSFIVFMSVFSFSMVASADDPTEIYIDTPGNTILLVPENVNSGDIVGILQTDADPIDVTFFEGLGPNPATARFNVNPNGEIICDNCNLDFESANPLNLPVEAQNPNVTLFGTISIQVTDVDEAPQFESFTTFLRYEEQVDPSPVFYSQIGLPVFDQDAGDDLSTLTFDILSCMDSLGNNCLGLFSLAVENLIDPFAGPYERFQVISPAFDFEDGVNPDFYTLEIEATDDGGNTSSEFFTIVNSNIGEVVDATSPLADETYGIGDTIQVEANLLDHELLYYNNNPFDEFFSPLPAENPVLELNLDSGLVEAELVNLPNETFTSGTISLETGEDLNSSFFDAGGPITSLLFEYIVQEGDFTTQLEYSDEDAIDLKTATLKDEEFGNDFIGTYYFETGPNQPVVPTRLPVPGALGSLSFSRNISIDGIRPFISNGLGSSVLITHSEGDDIEVIVEFSEDIQKSALDGTSTIDLDIGGTIVTADYNSGYTATLLENQLGFRYTVINGLFDDNGIEIVENSFTPDNIADLAGNEQTDFNNITFLLTNDLVDSLNTPTPPTPPSGSGGGGGGSASTSDNASNPFLPTEPDDQPDEQPEAEETAEEPEEIVEETIETEVIDEPIVTDENEDEILEEEPETNQTIPNPAPVNQQPTVIQPTTPIEQPEEVVEETIETEDSDIEEEINFQGSLNIKPIVKLENQPIESCELYDSEVNYENSVSFDCDPTVEFIDTNGPTIQLNLPRDITNQYPNEDIIITGQVREGEDIDRVAVYADVEGQEFLLGIADVDISGRFMIRNNTQLPRNSIITVIGRDVDSDVSSPDYNLLVNQNLGLVEVKLDSFVGKTLSQMFGETENADYWTFVSMRDIENGLLEAKVESEFNTYHKAYWQSVLMGSSAISGSNSNLVTLVAPDEKALEIKAFSRHRVTILAERADAKSSPLVIEYYVLPNGFTPAVVILVIALIALGWYGYNRKQNKKLIVSEETSMIDNQS